MKEARVIYWSRRDFRLTDNRALTAAIAESAKLNSPLIPLFIVEDYMRVDDPAFQFGLPSRIFLQAALPEFAKQFPFFLTAYGKAVRTLKSLSKDYSLSIHVNEDVYPDFYTQVQKLRDAGHSVKVYADMLTIPKDTVTGSKGIYSIFTPFKNAVWNAFVTTAPTPPAHPEKAHYPSMAERKKLMATYGVEKKFKTTRSLSVGSHRLNLSHMDAPSLSGWYTTEHDALSYFKAYLSSGQMDVYKKDRDSLSNDALVTHHGKVTLYGANSRMSLALAWGLISARTCVHLIQKHYDTTFTPAPIALRLESAVHFISELIWREFYKYLFYHHKDLMHTEFQAKFRGTIKWVDDAEALKRFKAWIEGRTGYPLVDAAMMQLARTGYMHNRARMVVASVLTKNLGVDWRWGQEYFRAALFDLDESSNNGGWQWGASVGADPKPIRIFNPILQAETHDPDMVYQKKWLSTEYLTHPPQPLVPHKDARTEALSRYGLEKIKPRDY